MAINLGEAEALVGDLLDSDQWVLIPKPIPSLAGPKKRAEFEKAVKDARYELVHKEWRDALEAARELSDCGGIENVIIARVRHIKRLHVEFKDGKQTGRQ